MLVEILWTPASTIPRKGEKIPLLNPNPCGRPSPIWIERWIPRFWKCLSRREIHLTEFCVRFLLDVEFHIMEVVVRFQAYAEVYWMDIGVRFSNAFGSKGGHMGWMFSIEMCLSGVWWGFHEPYRVMLGTVLTPLRLHNAKRWQTWGRPRLPPALCWRVLI